MKLQEKLNVYQQERKALLATNFYNYETLRGIIEAFAETGQSGILQLTRSSIDYLGLDMAVKMARSAIESHRVQAWLHLDHASSVELIHKCLDAGFDSVMIDASEKSFEENIKLTQHVVKLAAPYKAQVEAELGFVAKLGQNADGSGFTRPEEAAIFVRETGVDSLAVAIGTAHGFYKDEPKLDLQRLAEINQATDVCLVLHGGSGVPENILRDAISRGICKINLATEIKNIFMKTIQQELAGSDKIDLRDMFPPGIQAVQSLVTKKIRSISQN